MQKSYLEQIIAAEHTGLSDAVNFSLDDFSNKAHVFLYDSLLSFVQPHAASTPFRALPWRAGNRMVSRVIPFFLVFFINYLHIQRKAGR